MAKFRLYSGQACSEELFSFRYRVIVDELGKQQADADHQTRRIYDALDPKGHQIIAYVDDEIVGCVRVNFPREGDVGLYHDLYGLGKYTANQFAKLSMCTRLMVDERFRKTSIAIKLFKLSYEFGLKNGIELNLVDSNKSMLEFFERFGYIHLFDRMHPDFGRSCILRLSLLDMDHLRQVRSPFLGMCAKFLKENRKLSERKLLVNNTGSMCVNAPLDSN